jgi:hypothetical protein
VVPGPLTASGELIGKVRTTTIPVLTWLRSGNACAAQLPCATLPFVIEVLDKKMAYARCTAVWGLPIATAYPWLARARRSRWADRMTMSTKVHLCEAP